jgi:hypothetical protein
MSQPKRCKIAKMSNSEQNVIDEVYAQAKKIEFPWSEAAPAFFVGGWKSFQERAMWLRNSFYGLY